MEASDIGKQLVGLAAELIQVSFKRDQGSGQLKTNVIAFCTHRQRIRCRRRQYHWWPWRFRWDRGPARRGSSTCWRQGPCGCSPRLMQEIDFNIRCYPAVDEKGPTEDRCWIMSVDQETRKLLLARPSIESERRARNGCEGRVS